MLKKTKNKKWKTVMGKIPYTPRRGTDAKDLTEFLARKIKSKNNWFKDAWIYGSYKGVKNKHRFQFWVERYVKKHNIEFVAGKTIMVDDEFGAYKNLTKLKTIKPEESQEIPSTKVKVKKLQVKTLEVKDEKGKPNLLKKTFRIYDSEANLVAKGSLKKGKATTAAYNYSSEKEYFLWLDDEIGTEFVSYEGKVYCKYKVKEKDYLIQIYYEMGFEDYKTRYNADYKLKINGPEGLEGSRNIRRHGNPNLIHPNDNYYILLDQIDSEEIQPVIRRKLEEWKRKEEIKQLEKRLEKIIDEIKENQQLLADFNAKKRFLGPFEIMLPGETLKSYMEWIIDNWIEQEWLEDYSWKPFSQFVGLLTAPLPVLLSGYPALVDAFKTLQTNAKDIVEAGPKGRYLTAEDAKSILEKYKMLSETLDDINIKLKQSKSTLIK